MAVIKGPGRLNDIPPPNEKPKDISYHPILKYTQGKLSQIRGIGIKKCKYCDKYKPLRTHHCSLCRTCILKMDHHCRILNNELSLDK